VDGADRAHRLRDLSAMTVSESIAEGRQHAFRLRQGLQRRERLRVYFRRKREPRWNAAAPERRAQQSENFIFVPRHGVDAKAWAVDIEVSRDRSS
jgi:hypothetical protein